MWVFILVHASVWVRDEYACVCVLCANSSLLTATLLSIVGTISNVAVFESKKAAPCGRCMARKTRTHDTRKTSLPRITVSRGMGTRSCMASPDARHPMKILSARGSKIPPHTLCTPPTSDHIRSDEIKSGIVWSLEEACKCILYMYVWCM